MLPTQQSLHRNDQTQDSIFHELAISLEPRWSLPGGMAGGTRRIGETKGARPMDNSLGQMIGDWAIALERQL
jgi:hypothetical protein